jgi:hypothetical protein
VEPVRREELRREIWGAVEGARVDVRLQDYGYTMPSPAEFRFEVDRNLTIMQDQISTRGGKTIKKGELYPRPRQLRHRGPAERR